LAGGFIEGAPLRLAAEIARVVNEQDKLHVIPIVTQGATENVNSLLYLRGVDAAIINTDALDEYKAQVPFIEQRLVYILRLFPVEYDTKFEDYYLPSSIEATDYPSLVPKGERIATISVPTILAAYNWPQQSDRYRRVARLVDHLFSRLDRLQSAGFDPKWKGVNLRAKVPGLERFRQAQQWLDRPQAVTAGTSQ